MLVALLHCTVKNICFKPFNVQPVNSGKARKCPLKHINFNFSTHGAYSSGILPFLKNSRSMTLITWQMAVDD